MSQQVINIGAAPDDSTGDPLRLSFDKTNENFTELYAKGATEGLWNYNQTSSDTSTAPVSGRFKTNSGNYRAATQIAINAITIQGIDRSSTLRTLLVGDLIQCQDSTNPAAWCRYGLQSLPVDHGTWFQLNVTFQADGGVASGDNQEIVFVFTASSSAGGGGSGGGGSAEYTFSTNTSAPPNSGQIRFNNAAVASATIVWINNATSGGTDLKRYFETLSIGTKLYIQDESDSSQYAKYQIASVPVDHTTYWEFPVTYLASGGALVNQQRAVLIVQPPPAAAAGAPIGAEYITSTPDLTLTAERVLTDTASITWDRTTPGQIKASTAAGVGNVSNSGTPTAGQYGKWVTATAIQGVAPATVLSDIGAQPAGSYQPLDADLTAIAALTGTNTIYYRSAANTWAAVTIGTGLAFSGGNLTATGGGGNVSNSGTPTAGSYGKWVTATTIQGAAPATVLSDIGAASNTNFPAGAWTAWTPTITASSGTITSTTINSARYIQLGKTVIASIDVTITDAGSGTGALIYTLPVAAKTGTNPIASGRELAIAFIALTGSLLSTTQIQVAYYNNTTVVVTNTRLLVQIIYEVA